jgi:MFS family permease
VITIVFKEDQEKYLGWAEVATGMGLAIGPVIGSLIFTFFGYSLAFMIYGIVLLICAVPLMIMIP